MKNIILIVAETLICYTGIIILNKKYKTDGLYVYGIIATFISCIMSLKQIDLLNVKIPIGFGVTMSLFIAGNIITQNRGPEAIKTYLSLIFITALLSCCFLNLSGVLEPSKYNESANNSYDKIFEYNLRVYVANIISILSAVFLGSKLYYLMKKINNKIIISNLFSIIIVELLENILFILIGYLFDFEIMNLLLALIFRYMIKTIIGIVGTIPIYITNNYK